MIKSATNARGLVPLLLLRVIRIRRAGFGFHPDHDLVFRTYVGMTQDQLTQVQKSTTTRISADASVVQANDLPLAPKSMNGSDSNFAPAQHGKKRGKV